MLDLDTLPSLTTARLELRALTDADIPALFHLFSDPEALRYWSHGPFTREAQARELLERVQVGLRQRQFYQWGIARCDSGELIGTCTLFNLHPTNRRAELGFMLSRGHWGRGLMREALERLLDFGFRDLGLHRLEADTDPGNTASNGLLERLGFRREGLLRQRWFVHGQWADTVYWGLLGSESQYGRP